MGIEENGPFVAVVGVLMAMSVKSTPDCSAALRSMRIATGRLTEGGTCMSVFWMSARAAGALALASSRTRSCDCSALVSLWTCSSCRRASDT